MIATWSNEAEMSCLGSALLATPIAEQIFGIVSPADFFSPAHSTIADHIQKILHRKATTEPMLVINSLRESGEIDEVGGVDYVVSLIEYVPSAANGKHFAGMVYEKAVLRRLERFTTESDSVIHDDETTPQEKLSKIADMLHSVESSMTPESRKVVDMNRVLLAVEDLVIEAEEKAATGAIDKNIIPTMHPQLAEIIVGYERGTITTIGARSSMGKTSFGIEEGVHFALKGIPVLIATREMTPEKIAMRVLSTLSGVPVGLAKYGKRNEKQVQAWADASEVLWSLPIRFLTNTRATVNDLKREARGMTKDFGVPPVIIDDYIQLALNGAQNMHMAMSQMMIDYRSMVKDLGCAAIILSQLSRGVEGRDDKRPSLSDLKESGSVEENSDVVLLIYRDEYYKARKEGRKEAAFSEAEIIVAKNREGGLGVARLPFRPAFTTFTSAQVVIR